MSLIYYFIISSIGFFRLGRFIDLFQQDLIIILLSLILIFEIKRWHRIRDK
jgi:hypothetical protein